MLLLENSGKYDDNRVGKRKAIDNLDEPLNKKQKNSKESSTITNTRASITTTSKTRNSNFKRPNRKNSFDFAMSDERLKAYGINPKKFKNKMKYGKHVNQ